MSPEFEIHTLAREGSDALGAVHPASQGCEILKCRPPQALLLHVRGLLSIDFKCSHALHTIVAGLPYCLAPALAA